MARLALILIVLCSFGCASLGNLGIQSPTALVKGVNVQNIDREGFTMLFDLDVTNPNGFDLPLGYANYTLALGDASPISGKVAPDGVLRANQPEDVKLPVTLTYQSLLDTGLAIAKSGGKVPYKMQASLGAGKEGAGGLLGNVRVPLSYEGTLDVAQLVRNPQALTSPAARELGKQLLGSFLNR